MTQPPGPYISNETRITSSQITTAKSEVECREIGSSIWDQGVEKFGIKLPFSNLQDTEGLETLNWLADLSFFMLMGQENGFFRQSSC